MICCRGFVFNADTRISGGGGGGGTDITVFDENTQIISTLSSLKFVGSNIQAVANGTQAIIYSPPPTFVSHFHTTDGIGSCTVGDTMVVSRKVAAPTVEGTPYKLGSFTAGSFQNSTNNSNLVYSTVNPLKTALATFISFITVGFIPLFSFVFSAFNTFLSQNVFLVSTILTGLSFFLIGIIKGKISGKNQILSAVESFAIGMLAAGIAYGVGVLLENITK
jgi:hypothetical protein